MTTFSGEARGVPKRAARARLIAQMEVERERSVQTVWGDGRCMFSIKILICLIVLITALQIAMAGVKGGMILEKIVGGEFLLPSICMCGVLAALMTHRDQKPWKLIIGAVCHCLCSAAMSAYVFLFFFTVLGFRGEPSDILKNSAATAIWGMLCFIYVTISLIFLCYTYACVRDLFTLAVAPLDEIIYGSKIVCKLDPNGVLVPKLKLLVGGPGVHRYELV